MADLITSARAQLLAGLSAADATLLASLITAAGDMIEKECRRTFAATTYTKQKCDGNGLSYLYADNFPITALSAIYVLEDDDTETTMASTNFEYEANTGEIRFKRNSSAAYAVFPAGWQNIEVSYTAGFATVPALVQEACAQLTLCLYQAGQRNALVVSESLGAFSRSYADAGGRIPTIVAQCIMQYKRWSV